MEDGARTSQPSHHHSHAELQQYHKICRGAWWWWWWWWGGGVRGARTRLLCQCGQPGWGCAWYREGCAQAAASPALEQVGLDRGAAPGERAGIGKEVVTVCAPGAPRWHPKPQRIARNPAHTRPQAPQRAPASAKRTHKCVSLVWACGGEWEERVRVKGGLEHPGHGGRACSGAAPPALSWASWPAIACA